MLRKFGSFPRGKWAAIGWRYPAVVFSCAQCFCASKIHWTLTWTTGYAHTWSFLCVHIHMRVGNTDESAQILTRKNSHQFFSCSGRVSNLWSLDLKSMLYQLSHPVTVIFKFWVDAVHTNGGQAQTSLHYSWFGGTEKLSFILPSQGIRPID